MKKPSKAERERQAKIAATVALLEPYRDDEEAVLRHLPDAFSTSFGVPLDMADQHHLMLSGVVLNFLVRNSV